MPRLNSVDHCRTSPGKCGKCDKKIEKGQGYLYWAFFRGPKNIRCLELKCKPRNSDLCNSKMSGVYAVVENVEDFINGESGDHTVDDIRSTLEEAASSIRDVAGEYDDWGQSMPAATEQAEEKSSNLNGFADELDGVSIDEEPDYETIPDGATGAAKSSIEEKNKEARQEWWDNAVSVVEDALSNCPD